MKKSILIARGVKELRNGGVNAKGYPFWDELVMLLKEENYRVEELTEVPLDVLEALIKTTDVTICVDSFIQHYCWYIGKQTVVLWGMSDPEIFGHPENINLLKDRKYLRTDPWRWWEDVPCNNEVWISPEVVLQTIQKMVE